MGVELIDSMGTDARIAHAARVSTKGLSNQTGKIEGLVKALWRDGHYSPFEHCAATFAFDVPMFVRDQIIRHKSLSFNVKSARYSKMEPVFWVPHADRPLVQTGRSLDYRRELGDGEERTAAIHGLVDAAYCGYEAYQDMLAADVCGEVARAALPANLYTQFWATGNLRSWLHFLDARLHETAQAEVRDAARQVECEIRELFPVAYRAWSDARNVQ